MHLGRQRFLRSVGETLDDIGTSPESERHDPGRLRMLTREVDEHARQLTAACRPVTQLSWTPMSRKRLRTKLVQLTALTSPLRGLTVSLRREAGALSPEHAATARHLAHVAHSLAESHPASALPDVPVHDRDPDPVAHHLHHITELLRAIPPDNPSASLSRADLPGGAV